jgi:hypothetical protein
METSREGLSSGKASSLGPLAAHPGFSGNRRLIVKDFAKYPSNDPMVPKSTEVRNEVAERLKFPF